MLIINKFLLVGLFIISILNLYRKNPVTSIKLIKNTPINAEMQKEDKRYQELKEYIPKGEIVGYVGEKDFEFHKSQFFLAPNLLDAENTKRKYILVKIYPNLKDQLLELSNYRKIFKTEDLFLLKRIR